MTPFTGSRIRLRDSLASGFVGLLSRRTRSAMTAIGIAIGIAAMVAVVAISASSRAHLLTQLEGLGTDHLRVSAGQSFMGDVSPLPDHAAGMVARAPQVESAGAVGVTDLTVRRTDLIPEFETGGLRVLTVDAHVAETLSLRTAAGAAALDGDLPVTVLGAEAANRLGVEDADHAMVWLGERWFTVAGVLEPSPLAPELDSAALVAWPVAESLVGDEIAPTTVYARTVPDAGDDLVVLLARSVRPDAPESVEVSRPSDAITARAAADVAMTSLLVGLGGVALLVGGVGIANVMVIAVLERRAEIGLRRALGATRSHIRRQFVAEALLLSGGGGLAGVLLGAAIATAYAAQRGWPVAIPPLGLAGGLAAALVVGAVAGLYPAARAARLAPADAVRPR